MVAALCPNYADEDVLEHPRQDVTPFQTRISPFPTTDVSPTKR
jgi:hypothetical protein